VIFFTNIFFIIVTLTIFLNANECLTCHAKKQNECKKNIHYSLKNEINLTLKAWGVEGNYTLQTLPLIKQKGYRGKGVKEAKSLEVSNNVGNDKLSNNNLNHKSYTLKAKDLAIDFLRRKCLRCHLTSKEVNSSGNSCLACHNKHTNKGDSFRAKARQDKCLKCHNGDFIGTDYLGLFPKDFDKSYRAPLTKDGFYPTKKYRNSYHHLIEDVHFKKGLSCIDCHKMNKKASCTSCHNKVSAKNHPNYHKNISCIACHSAWQVNSYKRVILRSDIPNYKEFKRLKSSEDKYLEEFLTKALKDPTIAPAMPDFLTNKMHLGLWYMGYEFRRWERFYLINYKGKIELARPMLDFELTYINDKNQTIIDAKKFGGFVVAKPHTIIKEAKSCAMCHENELNLNDKSLINYNLLKGKLIEGTPLTKEQIKKLDSKKYKLIRAKEMFR